MPHTTGLRVFISATTDDLGECRRRVADAVRARGHAPVIQDKFPPDPRELAHLLEAQIKDCHVVILLVGFAYGRKVAEPNPFAVLLPAGWDGCSYTQLEFFLATHWRKQFFLFFVPEGSPLDTAPAGDGRTLQDRYRNHIRANHRQVRRPIPRAEDAVADVESIDFNALRVAPVPWPEDARFDPIAPALPPVFVGRVNELRELEDAVHRRASISLVGDTRSGKTSLLRTSELRARAFCPSVTYVNAQDSAGRDEAAFVQHLTGSPAPATPDGAADALKRWAKAQAVPPLILVDEGDSLIRHAQLRFFERLRALVEDRALMLVLATRRDLAEAFQEFRQTGSPFGNNLTEHRLALLEPEAAEVLAARAGGHAALLREWAGRHPCFLQLAGWHLQRTVDTERALEAFREEAYIRLKEIWQKLTGPEQLALQAALERPSQRHFKLRRRGLLTDEGQPFGRVLSQWWNDDPQAC